MGTKRRELEAYRDMVFQELRARAEKLKELDGKLASLEYLMGTIGSSRALLTGDTRKVLAQASYKSKLRKDRETLLRKRREAQEDLKRAEDRLEEVDTDLAKLDESSGDEVVDESGGGE